MGTYWFRPKRYGYGATPVTWQGWAVTIVTALVVVLTSVAAPTMGAKSTWTFVALLVVDAVAIGALVVVSYRKTEGGWRWRWGGE
jgi:hypothetical protein